VIVSWNLNSVINKHNCLRLFFDFQKILKEHISYYMTKFGLFPRFKAGIHLEEMTVAEIGVLKRSVEYLSDILNTAARIQGVCNKYMVGFLISRDLKTLLGKTPEIETEFLESVQLKEKQEFIEIFRAELKKR